MKDKIISSKNLPFNSPIPNAILYYLFLDRIHAPEWAWTVAIIFLALLTLCFIVEKFNSEKVDIFAPKDKGK